MPQTWDMYLDKFPVGDIMINKCPVNAISYIKYYDTDGDLQTWSSDNYSLDSVTEPCRVSLAYGVSYPGVRNINNAVNIRFTCGYTTVPEALKSGMFLYLSWLYDNRGDEPKSRPAKAIWDIWFNYRISVL